MQSNFLSDFFIGCISGSLALSTQAHIEKIKLYYLYLAKGPQFECQSLSIDRYLFEESWASFWKRNFRDVFRYFPTTAIIFSINDALKRQFQYNVISSFLCGGIAGSIGLFIVHPLDLSRTILQKDIQNKPQERQFKGLLNCVTQTIKKDGFIELYKSFGISVVSIFVYRGLYFGGYDAGKKAIWNEEQMNSSIIARFCLAHFVVGSSTTLAYPLDTIRRRLLMQGSLYYGSIDCFKKILKEEGVRGFYKGNLSNNRKYLAGSLNLVFYEEFQKVVARKNRN